MKSLVYLSIIFCTAVLTILSCSKNSNPDQPATKPCINVTLTSLKGTDSQTVGLNVPISPISYKISNNQSSDTSGLAAVSISAIGLPSGITTTYTGGVLTISGSAVKDSSNPFVYVIATTGNSCNLPLTGVISVKNCATIGITTPSEPYFQVVPSNTAIAPISYTVGGGGTGASVTGLPTGVTGIYSAGIFTITGTLQNAPDSMYHYKITTSGGYCNASDSGIIVVTTCPVITLTSAPGTDIQIVALNQTIQPITYVVTGHYTGITLSGGFPPGVTGVVNGNTITITGTPISQYGSSQGPGFEYDITVNTAITSDCDAAKAGGQIDIQ